MSARILAVCGLLVLYALFGCRAGAPPVDVPIGEVDGQEAADSAPMGGQVPAGPTMLEPFPGILVRPDEAVVEVRARVCIDGGWLEQIACARSSREHESLVVPQAKPSQIHAALLMAGFEPGQPGGWSVVNDQFRFTAPRGQALDVFVRYRDASGDAIEEPIGIWIRDHSGVHEFPDEPWIFGGSRIEPNPEWMGPGEHYMADMTGSIIGLVTFGDEVIGFSRVLADQAAVHPPQWEVNTDRIPPIGTEVSLILRRAEPRD